MKSLSSKHSCGSLLAPVRPTGKALHPLVPMEEYVQWKRPDGSPFDPWIRVHWRMGAIPLCVAPNTLTVEASIGEWESWTGLSFPSSGSYPVPGGLQLLRIDRESGRGRYEDPNIWMLHR
jgi:hypothetical protein